MADQPGDPVFWGMAKQLAPYAPGMAGAIIGMSLGESLTLRGRMLAGAVSLCCVVWLAPFLSEVLDAFVPGPGLTTATLNFVGFVTGAFGFALISGLAQAVAKYASDPLGLVKFQMGPWSVGHGGEQ